MKNGGPERRYIVHRRDEGVFYMQVEVAKPSEDVRLMFIKPGDHEWSSIASVWSARGQGWRQVSQRDEEAVLAELPHVTWTPRGVLQAGHNCKEIDADHTEYEYGLVTRIRVPDDVRGNEFPADQFYLYNFDPYDLYAAQGLITLRAMPSVEVLLESVGILVREFCAVDRDPVLTRYQPLNPDAESNPPTEEFHLG